MTISIIALDIAKNVFQAHGEDAAGRVVLQQRLGRTKMFEFFAQLPPCVVALEACGTSHFWGRELRAMGHDVRLIPAGYVRPRASAGSKASAGRATAGCASCSRSARSR